MEPERSLPCSKEPSTGPYPKPDHNQSIPPHPILRPISVLSTHLRFGRPSGVFPSGFPANILYAFFFPPIRSTFPAHLIIRDFIISSMVTVMKIELLMWARQETEMMDKAKG
jgi:hypothetical protein